MDQTRRNILALGALAPLPWLIPGAAFARATPAVCAVGGVAIGGHDPVAYFTEGQPIDGKREYALMWRGALWLFASDESMDHFTRTPRAFAPRYGGYCAMSMAEGRIVPGDPSVWEIDDGRLYLLHSEADREAWDNDVAAHVREADSFWPDLLRV